MTDEQETQEQQISVETIENIGDRGEIYRYFRIKDSHLQGVIFTITEIKFVPVHEVDETAAADSEEMTALGRVLFEETQDFTSRKLLEDETFGTVLRDVFDKIVEDIAEIAARADEALELAETESETETDEKV